GFMTRLASHLLLEHAAVSNFETLGRMRLMVHGRNPVESTRRLASSCRQRRAQRARECGALMERVIEELGENELIMVNPTVESIVELYSRLTGDSLSQAVIDKLRDAIQELQ